MLSHYNRELLILYSQPVKLIQRKREFSFGQYSQQYISKELQAILSLTIIAIVIFMLLSKKKIKITVGTIFAQDILAVFIHKSYQLPSNINPSYYAQCSLDNEYKLKKQRCKMFSQFEDMKLKQDLNEIGFSFKTFQTLNQIKLTTMKFILILLLSIWLTNNSPIKKESEAIQFKRKLYEGNYTESDCPEQIMIYEGLEQKSTLGYFNFMRTIPLCNWDCSYYKMISERGVPDNEIAMAEPYTEIFTYVDSYNGETNSDEGAISVNSIIACAFWVGTGLPTYIAFLIFCLGNDVDYSQKDNQNESQSNKTPVKTQAYTQNNELQQMEQKQKTVAYQASSSQQRVEQTTQKNRDSQQIILEQTLEDQAQLRKLNQFDQSSKTQQKQQQATHGQQSQQFSQSSAQRSGQNNEQLYEVDLQQNQQQVKTYQQQQLQQQGQNTYQQSYQYQVQPSQQQQNQQFVQSSTQQSYQYQGQTSNQQQVQQFTQQSHQFEIQKTQQQSYQQGSSSQVNEQNKQHFVELNVQGQVECEKSDDTEMDYKVQAQMLSNTFFNMPAKK